MPVVPTYEDRGIRLDPGLNFRDSTKATGEMFGSGIGTALGNVGKGLTDVGEAAAEAERAKAAANLASVENDAAASAGVQRAVAGLTQRAGDGEAAGAGLPYETGPVGTFLGWQAEKDAIVKATRDSLPSGAQTLFDGKIEPIILDAKKQQLEAEAEAKKGAILGGYAGAADAYRDLAVSAPADEPRFQYLIGLGLAELDKTSSLESPEEDHKKAARATYISEARKRSALAMAATDPMGALRYRLDHGDELTATDKTALSLAMAPQLKAAFRQQAARSSQANLAPGQFAAPDLPPEAYAMLVAIAPAGAPPYDAQGGGGRFGDFAGHPGLRGSGGTSVKAGRYGLDGSAWTWIAKETSLGDFSPSSQDRGAWWLAQTTYRSQTNRSLQADIRAGRWADIRSALSPIWPGLATLSDERVGQMTGGVRAAASGGEEASPIGTPMLTPTVQLSPETEALLARLPEAQATEFRKEALAGVLEAGQERSRTDMGQRAQRAEGYRQRIDSGDKTLTPTDIEEDVVLNADQKAQLGAALAAKDQERLETEQNVQRLARGELRFEDYSPKTQAAVDRMWASIQAGAKTPEEALPQLSELARQGGMVPTQTINDIRQGLASKDPAKVAAALQTSQRLMTDAGEAVRRSDRSHAVENAVTDFAVAVANVGPDAAVARYIEKSDPARRPVIDDATMNSLLSRTTLQDVVDLFEDSTGHPYMGFMLADRDQILADYRDGFREALLETGDPELARARAGEAFKRVYGVTNVTGHPTLMKFPVERYHGEVGGSRDWQARQFSRLVEDVRARMEDPTIQPGNIMLEPAEGTAEAVAAGMAPIYRVFVMRPGADGKIVRQEFGDGLFFSFDEAGARAEQARADAAEELELRETYIENAQKRGQGHEDDQNLHKSEQRKNADLLNALNTPDEYRPVTGEQGGQGSSDPDAGETRVYTAEDVSFSRATLSLWNRKERERKARVDAEQRKAIGEEARKGNYYYVPPDDYRYSWDKAEREFTQEEIRQEKEAIAAEWNARRPIGLRGMLDRGAREIGNDGQLIANLTATKEALEARSREDVPAPKLWVTSYDQAPTLEKEVQTIEEPATGEASSARVALAAYRQSSTIGSMMSNHTWASDDGTTDPNFDVIEELKKPENARYRDYRDQALNIFNQAAFKAWKDQIDMEEEDKRVLEEAGVKGEVFSALASLISPETLLPGGVLTKGAVKSIMGASKAIPPAALVKAFEDLAEETLKAGFTEGIFQLSQQTRSGSEGANALLNAPLKEVVLGRLEDAARKKLMEKPEVKQAIKKFLDLMEKSWLADRP